MKTQIHLVIVGYSKTPMKIPFTFNEKNNSQSLGMCRPLYSYFITNLYGTHPLYNSIKISQLFQNLFFLIKIRILANTPFIYIFQSLQVYTI